MSTTLKRYFTGFSTQDSAQTGIRTFYDVDLVKRDLSNAFNTRVGERVMRPDYGCKLWDYLMEPLTGVLREQIIVEAIRICELDSRLVINDVQVYEVEQGFRIEITLLFQPWNVVDQFTATFERTDADYFEGSIF